MVANLYLGIDSSTQGITAVAVDLEARRVVHAAALNYERDYPRYGVRAGVLPDPDPRVAHAPPRMWADALDGLFARLRADGLDLSAVRALAVSGQQHGSVYLTAAAPAALAALRPDRPLADQLDGGFARATSPVWMDASTSDECAEIRAALGGARAATEATGSDVFERFTGPQVRRFWKRDPDAYERTAHIALASSFLTSLLVGRIAPLEPGDAAGMNLMDLRRNEWRDDALAATAPDLRRRLPPIVPSDTVVGRVHPWLAGRHGLAPGALVVVGTGDNPSSLVGTGQLEPGPFVVSLGTSDTCFALQRECRTDPEGAGHVFGAPTGGTMALVCFQNGSLARERVRAAYGLDWAGFTAAVAATPPGNGGRLLLPWFVPEIVPRVRRPGAARRGLDERDAAANCRAVLEAQVMALRLHSRWIGPGPSAVFATGGASTNAALRRIMADVFGCPVHRFDVSNGAALGAALRAAHADLRSRGDPAEWGTLVAGFTAPDAASRTDPDPAAVAVYARLIGDYAAFERETLAARAGAPAEGRA